MTCEEIKLLLAESWARTLSAQDSAALEQHLSVCELCRAESARLAELWRGLSLLPADEPGAGVRERFYESFSAYRDGVQYQETSEHRRRAGARQMFLRIAAGLALVIGGAGVGYGLRSNQASAGEITQLRAEVGSMRQLVTLSLLQQQSASERLRGVSWAYRAEPSDTEVLDALVAAVNHDTNVNVRLAAVDALRTFGANGAAREAVKQALSGETAPIVQVALIDLLVDLKETGAAPQLQRVAADNAADMGVRQRAEWALERLQ